MSWKWTLATKFFVVHIFAYDIVKSLQKAAHGQSIDQTDFGVEVKVGCGWGGSNRTSVRRLDKQVRIALGTEKRKL